jgi:outer membrane protein assembly factor BamA
MKVRHCLFFSLLFLYLAPPGLLPQDAKTLRPSGPIAALIFEGNHSVSSQQLQSQLHLFMRGDRYTAEDLASGMSRLERVYQDEGFLKVRIGPPDVRNQASGIEEGVVIRIPIKEGPRYVSGKVSVKGVTALGPQTLIQLYPLQKGQPFKRNGIAKWLGQIREAYSSLGYIRARCDVQETLNDADRTVDCTLDCTEGKPYSVEKITVVGDESIDRSKFKRRLLVSEGGAFDPENLLMSIQFLNRAGLYKPISSSDVEIAIDDARGVVDLTFHLFALSR